MRKLRCHSLTSAFLLLVLPALCGKSVQAEPFPLDLAAWQFANTGKYESWIDRRDLMVLHHPWDVSEKGNAAIAEQQITIPASLTAPLKLYWYMSDDYDGSTAPVNEGWLGQINLPGHRFKQVLLNGNVVWQQDVADATDVTLPSRFSVDLPDNLKAGDTIHVAFRLVDVAGSMERLPGDHRRVGDTDGIKEEDPWKFMTHLYIGDVVLASASEAVAPGDIPSVVQARKVHVERWPLAPTQAKESLLPVDLPVRHAPKCEGIVPLQTGVPFSMGVVSDASRIQLTDDTGATIPSAARPLDTWPDGSIRNAIVTALLPGGLERVTLGINAAAATAASPDNGLRFEASTKSDNTLQFDLAQGAQRVAAASGILNIDGVDASLYPEHTETVEESPIHREIEVRGHIKGGELDFGRFTLRVLTFSGQPLARLQFRVFHDQPGTRAVKRMALRMPWEGGPNPVVMAGVASSNGVASMVQHDAGKYRINDTEAEGQAPGWMAVTSETGSFLTLVRNFADQYPIAATWGDSAMNLELFSPTEAVPTYAPHEGEAKRYEIWIGLWDQEPRPEVLAALAAWMQNPPGLFNSDYACATGAFGPAAPHDTTRFPELTAFMQKTYGEIPGSMFYTTGIRNWGDLPYKADEGTWRNGYYDITQGLFSEYLMTGDKRWLNHLDASARHIMDIDVCHASGAHPEWVGSIRGYFCKDHSTDGPWNPTQRTKGMFNYARLTGDRDALQAAMGVADSAVAANRAVGSVSVRDHAGVLYALVAAYDETRDPKYLEAARQLAHDAMKRIDPRRGTYVEIHGNYGYRGNVPWMVAQLMEPMYDYYRQSGDVDAATAVVAMAESILAENRTRGVDGDVYGYSHNPHFKKSSSYHILIAPAVLYARELTYDTEFLKQARAMYNQTIAEGTVNAVMNCYWNTHTLLNYLNEYANEEAN